MSPLLTFLFLAFVIEKLVEVVFGVIPFFDHKKILLIDVAKILALIFGLIFAWGANLDFFALFDISFAWPYVGFVVSALIMMGGSSLVHDITEWIAAKKSEAKTQSGS